ncbi:MAG: chitobiase/beta-hexosaminidase C-terminal domain-containing protein [Terracidiphilus sp.]
MKRQDTSLRIAAIGLSIALSLGLLAGCGKGSKSKSSSTTSDAETVATPTFSVAGGTYTTAQSVSLSDSTSGATIYYTTDGTPPTKTSYIQYAGAITVSSTETIEAVGVLSGENDSAVASATYTINLTTAAPAFSVPGGTYTAAQTVTLSDSSSGATIYYTTDGSTPSASNGKTISSGSSITVSSSEVVNAIAVLSTVSSSVVSETYVIDLPSTATGDWTWIGGSNNVGQNPYGNSFDSGSGQKGVYGTPGTAASANTPGGRDGAVTWTDGNGNLWLFGGEGLDSGGTYGDLNDLWEYSFSAGQWTWISGSSTVDAKGIYGNQGTGTSANTPGARYLAVSWTDSKNDLWLFGGSGYDSAGTKGNLNDLWEYSSSASQWIWMGGSNKVNAFGDYGTPGTAASTNVPGANTGAMSWTDNSGNLWLFGGWGYDSNGRFGALNDLWKFTPSSGTYGEWTWMVGSDAAGTAGTYGTRGTAATTNIPGGRDEAMGWADSNGNIWLFGGYGIDSNRAVGGLNDLWQFTPSSGTYGQWTWMGGSNKVDAPGVYGTQGSPSTVNMPGARSSAVNWRDSSGNFWLLGGGGLDIDGNEDVGLNDLWEYNTGTNQWAWMGGSTTIDAPGVYGTLGTAAPANIPGARYGVVGWTDNSGNFWLFGGNGLDVLGLEGEENDLWEYHSTRRFITPSLVTVAARQPRRPLRRTSIAARFRFQPTRRSQRSPTSAHCQARRLQPRIPF